MYGILASEIISFSIIVLVKLNSKKKCTGSGNKDGHCGKSVRRLLGFVGVVRKSKAQHELNFARDARKNKEGFYRFLNQKKSTRVYPPSE